MFDLVTVKGHTAYSSGCGCTDRGYDVQKIATFSGKAAFNIYHMDTFALLNGAEVPPPPLPLLAVRLFLSQCLPPILSLPPSSSLPDLFLSFLSLHVLPLFLTVPSSISASPLPLFPRPLLPSHRTSLEWTVGLFRRRFSHADHCRFQDGGV